MATAIYEQDELRTSPPTELGDGGGRDRLDDQTMQSGGDFHDFRPISDEQLNIWAMAELLGHVGTHLEVVVGEPRPYEIAGSYAGNLATQTAVLFNPN